MRDYLNEAKQTIGFFDEVEAQFLIDNVSNLAYNSNILEIGSYYGRSTLFIISAMKKRQKLISVDTFEKLAAYSDSNHSFWNLLHKINDNRHVIIPYDIIHSYKHLREKEFELVFIDGNHSFIGITTDLTYGVLLGKIGGTILCHDVTDLFPGIVYSLDLFEKQGILVKKHQVKTLASYEIVSKPSWLTIPSVYRGE